MDLFKNDSISSPPLKEPLAVRLRPRTLKEYAGQEHILGPGKLLSRAIQSDTLSSLILYGPPGTGKTTLASVISHETKVFFEPLNAVSANVVDLRKAIELAKARAQTQGKKTILFVDEIHRFNKAQQDVLMPDVEKGNPILIGATTHNPFFSIVPALLSRSLVFELKPLSKEHLKTLLKTALDDKERGLGRFIVKMDEEALDFLAEISDGDARRALNALELGIVTSVQGDKPLHFTKAIAEESIQKKVIVYDADGDQHYDTISAFIKSMRGSDPDAAIYYLAKMIAAGEDLLFIARRIVICAAEDVGNADPQALVVAMAAMQASEFIGLPEARIPLAQAVIYIACAPKSNSAYLAINSAMKDISETKTLAVPDKLKDAHYKGAERLGHGKDYLYAHDYEGHAVSQEYLAEKKHFYIPTEQGFEKTMKQYLEKLEKALNKK